MNQKLSVLLIVEQCDPEGSSVPLEGYNYYREISQLTDATLVTHIRNRASLESAHPDRKIIYIEESKFIANYYQVADFFSKIGKRRIWPLYNTLVYPIYAEFNRSVYRQFEPEIGIGRYDIVHVITPMMPRYPVKAIKACRNTPFIIGPVNGGVPFPKGFQSVAREEFSYFNFLRLFGRYLIPGYRQTYEDADQILAGSTYTLDLIKQLFNIRDSQIQLFYENGIDSSFLKEDVSASSDSDKSKTFNLLFVGRLVPYKGADMLIEAISQLEPAIKEHIRLTIVGDGSERTALEKQAQDLHLSAQVQFTGWVPQARTRKYYSTSDLFCFPSVREFGGAVVIEAMASGLPCIVVKNGGIGEYVTEANGFAIEPDSREFVVESLTYYIGLLFEDDGMRQRMAEQAIARARKFSWNVKGREIASIYHDVLSQKRRERSNGGGH